MTTPPMRELTFEQAWQLTARDPWELEYLKQFPRWTCPPGDILKFPRDKREVVSTLDSTTWATEFTNGAITSGNGYFLAGETLQGMPFEAIPPKAKEVGVWVTSTMRGHPRLIKVPLPKYPWIEGHPHRGGESDRHWIGVYKTGRSWELIQLTWNPWGKKTFFGGILEAFAPKNYPDYAHWDCMEAGLWDASGNLIDGVGVTALGVQLSSLVVTPESLRDPHLAGIAVRDYHGTDGTLGSNFPANGDHVAIVDPPPDGLDGDALLAWNLGMKKGFRIFDRGGTYPPPYMGGLLINAGSQWKGSNIHTLRIPVTSLKLVTAVTA